MEKGFARFIKSGILWSAVFFAAVVVVLLLAVGSMERTVGGEQIAAAQNAIRRSAVQCYVLEGRFPDDLDHLVEQYGLKLDRARFVYHYESLGGNLLPDIKVFSVTEGEG